MITQEVPFNNAVTGPVDIFNRLWAVTEKCRKLVDFWPKSTKIFKVKVECLAYGSAEEKNSVPYDQPGTALQQCCYGSGRYRQPFVSYDWKMSKIGRFLAKIDQNFQIEKFVPNI